MLTNIFYINQLSLLMLCIINVVGISILSFSSRYVPTDDSYQKYMMKIIGLIISLSLISILDHFMFFLFFWGMSNLLLTELIMHKKSWQEAKESGLTAQKYLSASFVMIARAIALLAYHAETSSINKMISYNYPHKIVLLFLILMTLGTMIQSAIWPFHRWLISSVNAPTTVSALMHAGLVNGGGFLIVKFFNLYKQLPQVLDYIFILGLCTAVLGSLAKLLQPDIKKMLACSTIGQMGFMFMQLGLGLVPAALAHLFYHGFFKAYLFLRSASIIQEKRLPLSYPPTLTYLLQACICSIPGTIAFAYINNQTFTATNTHVIVLVIAYITLTQSCLTIITEKNMGASIRYTQAIFFSIIFGLIYGFCLYLVESFLKPLNLVQHLPLKCIHAIGIFIIIALWIIMLLSNFLEKIVSRYTYLQKIYVVILNWSQPYPKTITAHRNNYRHI